ncbi:hypothetical protein FVQ98_18205 [Ottowia sp. GY511]|uniref:Uncharacterized protein n=1 Tax=Ottowia flava TaxID=2675430 RepID=A0ABW4KTU8_9BURK|nr:hypothetical protein [Ottowia sp. GY511]TXK22437.1 hypothetical protein FVQ98_18205 [Ottowia sp. GY511]
MTIQADELLVLKAFYMGHAISTRKASIPVALGMADKAIEKFEAAEDDQEKIRLLFYLLLKAEILRGTPQAIEIRARAQEISRQIDEHIFERYMAIEDSTQSRKKIYGIQVGVIADEGVKPTVNDTVSDGFNVWTVRYDAACRALGIDERKLTKKEDHFLRKVTLKEMLEKHGVKYAVP